MYSFLLFIIPLIQTYRPKETVKNFMERLDSFLIQLPTEVTLGFKVEEAGERRPLDVDALYERLTSRYNAAYGRGVWIVERKIQSYMKEGLSREEAITRLAEEEGVTQTTNKFSAHSHLNINGPTEQCTATVKGLERKPPKKTFFILMKQKRFS